MDTVSLGSIVAFGYSCSTSSAVITRSISKVRTHYCILFGKYFEQRGKLQNGKLWKVYSLQPKKATKVVDGLTTKLV